MNVKQCRFLLNTVNKTVEKNNYAISPKIRSRIFIGRIAANFNPYTAELGINKALSCRIFRPIIKRMVRHELKHAEQFQIIARFFAGLAKNVDEGLNNFKALIEKKNSIWCLDSFNENFYKKAIARDGVIDSKHPLFNKAKQYIEAVKKYPDLSVLDDLEIFDKKGFRAMLEHKKRKMKLYKSNLLEIEAKKAEGSAFFSRSKTVR